MSPGPDPKEFALLRTFRQLFQGKQYKHRDSSLGDLVASQLYEDLVALNRSPKLLARVQNHERVVNLANKTVGKKSRRGDGTFGELVPTAVAVTEEGLLVARGEIANIEIGAETKILAKAMIKQIDRVTGDLQKQVPQFKRGAGDPIVVALVGINHAPYAVGYEGDRAYRTDGKANRHPIQEAADASHRLLRDVAPLYDEFILLHYSATNDEPFPFSWVNFNQTSADYGAALVRISREYDRRF
jgi:hypothetical protein